MIEWRFAKGKNALFPELATELVRLRADCVVAFGVAAIRAVKQLTDRIPIVMGTIDADPVERGFEASLAQPGGNITGFTGIAYDIAGKRLELLKETVPKATRAAILVVGQDRSNRPGPLESDRGYGARPKDAVSVGSGARARRFGKRISNSAPGACRGPGRRDDRLDQLSSTTVGKPGR